MIIYLYQLTRSVPVSIRDTGVSSRCYSLTHRRLFSDQKLPLSHYDVLDVKSDASSKEIKAAFYKLSKKHHPDVNQNDGDAAKKFTTISNAYDVLGDPAKKRIYDDELLSKRFSYYSEDYYQQRTNTYAQRARSHRPSSWRHVHSTTGYQNPFSTHRDSNFSNDFTDTHQAEQRSGQYRGPRTSDSWNHPNFDESYRTHYEGFSGDSQFYENSAEDTSKSDDSNEQNTDETSRVNPVEYLIYFSLGLTSFLVSILFNEMHFQQAVPDIRSRFSNSSKAVKKRTYCYRPETYVR